jgi:1,4-dihydroxy-2-naphthoate octaprenyltransferase
MNIRTKSHTVWAFAQLTRPMFLFGGVVLYALGVAIAASQGIAVDVGRAVMGQILVTSIQVMAHYSNEYYDYEVDRLVGNNRTWFSGGSGVLPSGQLDRNVARNAARVCAAMAIMAIVISSIQVPGLLIIGTISFLGAWFYSSPPLSLMGSGWGELTTSILTGLFVPLTGYVMQAGRIDPNVLVICAPMMLIYMAMIIAFQFPDRAADAVVGKRTLTVRLGLRRVAALHNALIIGGLASMFMVIAVNQWWMVARFVWLAVPLALWQIIGVTRRSRSGWVQLNLLTGGAVALSGLMPLLWLLGYVVS